MKLVSHSSGTYRCLVIKRVVEIQSLRKERKKKRNYLKLGMKGAPHTYMSNVDYRDLIRFLNELLRMICLIEEVNYYKILTLRKWIIKNVKL